MVNVDSKKYNNKTDSIGIHKADQNAYIGEDVTATIIYSASDNRMVKAALISSTNKVLADTSFNVTKGVRSVLVEFPSEKIPTTGDLIYLKYSIEDESAVLATDSVQITITEKPLTKALYTDGIPTSIEPASSINIDLKYEADTVCKIVVEVYKPNAEGILWKAKVVQPGRGIVNFNEALSSPLEYGTGYYFRIYMYRNGMNWEDPLAVNLGNLFFDVEDAWNPSINILNIDSIFIADKTIDLEFSYATKSNGKLEILLLDKNNMVVASEYREERYGNRNISRTMTVHEALVADELYSAIITYAPNNHEFEALSDTLKNIKVHDYAVGIFEAHVDFLKTDVKITPNPTSGLAYLNLNKSTEKIKAVEVFDITGSQVFQNTGILNSVKFEFDMSDFKDGTYIVRVSSASNVYTKKLMKE